jgi:hypothetical protein
MENNDDFVENMKKLHAIDQLVSSLGDFYPKCWWSLYTGCVNEGFTQEQAFALLTHYIHCTIKTV